MKTYKQKTFLQCFLLLVLITSVINIGKTQDFYIPGYGLNTLTFSEKNDFKLAALIPDTDQGMKLLLGYSPLKHLSLSAGMININKEDKFASRASYHGRLYTFSLGTYYSFDKTREDGAKRELLLSSRIGYARGGMKTTADMYQTDFDFRKLYFQMGVTYSIPSWTYGFYVKYNHTDFLKGDIAGLQNYPKLFDKLAKFEENRYFKSMEFKFQLIGGKGFLKGVLGGVVETGLSSGVGALLESSGPFAGVIIELDKLLK